MYFNDLRDMVGRTPIIRLARLEGMLGLGDEIYAMVESHNPTGSVKDRAALRIITDALREGKIAVGGYVVEATSGNMGVSLSCISALLGFRSVIVMPEGVSEEKIRLVRAYGGEVMLSDGARGMVGAIELARNIAAEREGYMPDQFNNPSSVLAHYDTTGPQILSSLGSIDALVCGVGSGGTLMGTGKYLRERLPRVKIIAVEPYGSSVLSGGASGRHGIEGIGAGFVPPLYDAALTDRVMTVTDGAAEEIYHLIPRVEGLRVGMSSAAALSAAIALSRQNDGRCIKILLPLPDSREKTLKSV